MKVTIRANCRAEGKSLREGKSYDLSEEVAKDLVRQGRAVEAVEVEPEVVEETPVEPKPVVEAKEEKKPAKRGRKPKAKK